MVSIRSILTGVVALLASSSAASPVAALLASSPPTPQEVVADINQLTQKTQALQGTAQSITPLNAPLIVLQEGPFRDLVAGYADMVQSGKDLISDLDGFDPVAGPDADEINTAFQEFAAASRELHEVLIEKAGILFKIPIISHPVTMVMLLMEAVINSIAILLMKGAPPRADDLNTTALSLDAVLQQCVAKYYSIAM
ncbi:hypothetical protein N658DRAFT_493259 [Parathielavia hyrcaniae]|uniref:Cell wall galactomannoprotein n=1 Tax=Parathielavia hyrcaniae TaxID=113614 RepID=A0AAN6QAD4_9PEZI|nr:hypothetical protein N658DRAFT_493259 [Parathielavia hyrcaniae]